MSDPTPYDEASCERMIGAAGFLPDIGDPDVRRLLDHVRDPSIDNLTDRVLALLAGAPASAILIALARVLIWSSDETDVECQENVAYALGLTRTFCDQGRRLGHTMAIAGHLLRHLAAHAALEEVGQ